jgi:hypothetical protein
MYVVYDVMMVVVWCGLCSTITTTVAGDYESLSI